LIRLPDDRRQTRQGRGDARTRGKAGKAPPVGDEDTEAIQAQTKAQKRGQGTLFGKGTSNFVL